MRCHGRLHTSCQHYVPGPKISIYDVHGQSHITHVQEMRIGSREILDLGSVFQLCRGPGLDQQHHASPPCQAGSSSGLYQRRLQHVEYLRLLHVPRQRGTDLQSCLHREWHHCVLGHVCGHGVEMDVGETKPQIRRGYLCTWCH